MKKLLAMVMAALILITFTACDNFIKNSRNEQSALEDEVAETVSMEVGKKYTIDGYADFALFKAHTTKRIFASMGGNSYYENDKDSETYIDIILNWTNRSNTTMAVSDLVSVRAVNQNGQEYTRAFYCAETQNATNLSQHENLSPLSTARLHCALSVPEDETNLTLKLRVKNQGNITEYVYEYTLGTVASTAYPLTMDEAIEAPGYAAFILTGVEYSDDVCPSNTDIGYSHYSVDDIANTYLVVKFDITNLGSSYKDIDSFTHITATFANKYSYQGFTVVETEDGHGFSPYEDIAPLTTRHFYHLIEVPKSITEDNVTLTVVFDGNEYSYTV